MAIADYIGIPFVRGGRDINRGLDCWGLVVHFYKNEFGISLPTYSHINTEKESISESSTKLMNTDCYTNFEVVDTSKFGDIALFRAGIHPIHVGIVIDRQHMLHANDTTGSVIENYMGTKWINKLESFHRYKQM